MSPWLAGSSEITLQSAFWLLTLSLFQLQRGLIYIVHIVGATLLGFAITPQP